MGCFVVDALPAPLGSLAGSCAPCKPSQERRARSRAKLQPRRGHERPGTAAGNLRLLPADRACRIRPSAAAPSMTASSPRGCATAGASPPRRSTASAASWQPSAAAAPRVPPSSSAPRAAPAPAAARLARLPTAPASPATRSAISASSTTGRNICCSSTPAARSGWSRAASRSSSPTSIRARRRCACSMPASATAPCCCACMRAMHDRFPHMPFYVVGKEISLEDVRLDLAEDVGPLLRASGDRAGADQSRLCGRALARGEIAQRRLEPGLARGAARPAIPPIASSSRSPISSRSWRRTGRPA